MECRSCLRRREDCLGGKDLNIHQKIAEELGVRTEQVDAAVQLIDEGATIPFIARYRKEVTGSLDDEQLRTLDTRLTALRNLEERREKIRAAITEQGKMTEALGAQLDAAETLVQLEDIYLPYRPKRSTRATVAIERGLSELADLIWAQKTEKSLEEEAERFISEEKGIGTAALCIQGALDILAERFSDARVIRSYVRDTTKQGGQLCAARREQKGSAEKQNEAEKEREKRAVYETYYDFREPLMKATGYRVLAMNRGEKEKILRVYIEAPSEEILSTLRGRLIKAENKNTAEAMDRAITDSYVRLMAPAVERDIRNELTEAAETGAIEVFRKNLHQLLMQPPIAGEVVLGWDPAFRTGCKLAVVDETGKVLDTAVVYPTMPTNEKKQRAAAEKLREFIEKYGVTLISIGNGTASRESEQFVAEVLKELPQKVSYVITNEAGASVYSASALATEEFPAFDVGQRSAASIARRVQDPLAELVKIDPKSIGVGQYQHDMEQKRLGEALEGVVEDCVNAVGVDLNTASAPLLRYISGITKTTAKNIVSYREENGKFKNRKELLKVSKLGPKAFEQCAGFLRISGGENPLDDTGVHPESYALAKAILEAAGESEEKLREGRLSFKLNKAKRKALAEQLSVGEVTLESVEKELTTARRDPREDMPKPILKSDVLQIEDLKPGMILRGTVRNVIDFGAFVDIGVHQDGLVHISRMKKGKFVKHPSEVVKVGDIVEVKVVEADVKKQRIGLSMIL